mmetsp:Transcript_5705/g.7486  ORF Transcript_5705/g.7486 Transcript_5705/m.7486 type:complete len:230 (+) Transcript_5705:90-779(+)
MEVAMPVSLLCLVLLSSFMLGRIIFGAASDFVVASLDLGLGFISFAGVLLTRKKLPKFVFPLYIQGCLLGATWEFGFDLLGDDFCSILIQQLRTPGLRAVSHSFTDGLLFILGVGLVLEWCPKPHFSKWSGVEILMFLLWGNVQEIVVDIAGNGWIWQYHQTPYNPVMFTLDGESYTFIPQFVWIISPCVFYFLTLVQFSQSSPSEGKVLLQPEEERRTLESPLLQKYN